MANRKWKEEIYQRDNYQCKICGSKFGLTVHHKTPKSKSGKGTPENCVIWCTLCHRFYHKRYGLMISDDFGNPIGGTKGFRNRKKHRH